MLSAGGWMRCGVSAHALSASDGFAGEFAANLITKQQEFAAVFGTVSRCS